MRQNTQRVFVSLDGADHLMTRKEDSIYVGEIISSWVLRYITIEAKKELKAEGDVIAVTSESGYTTEMMVAGHPLIADEPIFSWRQRLGPSPYDYLTAALGACTSMTLRMYADHKKWDLKEVKVHLTHHKSHKQDCEDCENSKSKIDHFDKVIELEGDLDDAQRARLLEIADRCPVHRTLHGEVVINTQLAD